MILRSDLQYCVSKTLFGEQLIVGLGLENSYIKFGKKQVDHVTSFIDQTRGREMGQAMGELPPQEQGLVKLFDSYGYYDTSPEIKSSFNEYVRLGRIFASVVPRPFAGIRSGGEKKTAVISALIALACIVFCLSSVAAFPAQLDLLSMSVTEIILCALVMPVVFLLNHELGHYVMAQLTGTEIKSISVGFFILYPIVLVQYNGLHLKKTTAKVLVTLGGVLFNLLALTGGLALKRFGVHSIVVDFWILANLSGILTNMDVIGMTDGYFFASSVTGCQNLRLKGYRALHAFFTRRAKSEDMASRGIGIVMVGALLYSCAMLAWQTFTYSGIFGASPVLITPLVCIVVAAVLFSFIRKVRRLS